MCGGGRNNSVSTTPKIVAFAPMPSARHTTAAATSAGLRAKVRSAYRRSWSMRLVDSGLGLVHDTTVEQMDRPVSVLRVARIVRHHAHRRAAAVQCPQQL